MSQKYTVCLDCKDRTTGCHSHCKAYLAFMEENRKAGQETVKRHDENQDYRGVRFGRTYKLHRNKERK